MPGLTAGKKATNVPKAGGAHHFYDEGRCWSVIFLQARQSNFKKMQMTALSTI